MKCKKLLSVALAVCMTFGSAAMLPRSTFAESASIYASAAQTEDKYWSFEVGNGSSSYDLLYRVENNEIAITGSSIFGHEGVYIYVPDHIGGLPVTKIARGAFWEKYIVAIHLPETLTEIDDYAFEYCGGLETVVLPDGLKRIGERAFYCCESMKTIAVPDSIQSIGDMAFGYCYSQKESGIRTKLSDFSFCVNNCPAIKKYAEDNGFKLNKYNTREIYTKGNCGDNVTYKLYPDHTIELSGTGSTFDYQRYQSGNQLTEMPNQLNICFDKVIINEGITRIGRAFFQNGFIKELILPDSVTSLGLLVFHNANRLKTLKIGKGLSNLEDSYILFSYTRFENISVDKYNKYFSSYKNSLYDKKQTKLIKYCSGRDQQFEIPSTVDTIGNDSVSSNFYLKNVKIPVNVKHIDIYAFDDCPNLKSITIPESVTDIHIRSMGNVLDRVTNEDVKNEDLTINCYKNSAAEKFAKEKGIKYNIIKCDHKYKLLSTKPSNCTQDGEKKYICELCGHEKTETIPKSHNYVTEEVAPNCTTKGYTLHKCTRCGESYKDTYTNTVAHKFSTWKTAKKATCTAAGSKTRTCSVCKKTETAAIAKLGHSYKATVVKPTCSAKGYTLHKCTKCGYSYKDKYTNTVAHKFSNWTTTKKATCKADGTQTRKCSVCGKTETKTIKTTGHKFSDWTTTSFNVDKGTSTQKRICSVCKKTETRPVKNAVVRYAGANRYDTAAMLSKASHKTTSDTVIIADAMTFQDALIAVPLAKAYNAPLLLANPNIVTKQTEAELARLKAKKVIIVNTNKALKKGTLDDLKKKYTTQIISGSNCFETSKRVAEALQAKTKKAPTDVFFTTNKAFADALSISPVAALKGAPILYVDPSKKNLDSNILAYLNKVKGSVKNVYIVGGKVAVPAAIENSIKKALPKKNVKRFDGAQRYETCVMINKYFAGLLNSKTVCVAKGLDFPDALAGGVFAANQKAPLLLADSALRDAQKSFLKNKKPNKLYIFGGTVAVPDKLAKEVAKMSV